MTKKWLAVLVTIAMVVLTVAPAAEAQSNRRRRPYIPGYSRTPLERVHTRNLGIVDGPLAEMDYRSSVRWGSSQGRFAPRYGYDYPPSDYGFWSDSSYYEYGLDNPYSYGGYDYGYSGGRLNYRRHRGDIWKVAGAGALGFLLGRVTTSKHKTEAAPAVPARPPAEAPIEAGCYPTSLSNFTGHPVFVGQIGGEGFEMNAGQVVQTCLLPTDCAYTRVGESLVPASFLPSGNGVAIR